MKKAGLREDFAVRTVLGQSMATTSIITIILVLCQMPRLGNYIINQLETFCILCSFEFNIVLEIKNVSKLRAPLKLRIGMNSFPICCSDSKIVYRVEENYASAFKIKIFPRGFQFFPKNFCLLNCKRVENNI